MIIPSITPGDIDAEIQPLISALNEIGLRTTACCSGHGRKSAYIRLDMASISMVMIQGKYIDIYWNLKNQEEDKHE